MGWCIESFWYCINIEKVDVGYLPPCSLANWSWRQTISYSFNTIHQAPCFYIGTAAKSWWALPVVWYKMRCGTGEASCILITRDVWELHRPHSSAQPSSLPCSRCPLSPKPYSLLCFSSPSCSFYTSSSGIYAETPTMTTFKQAKVTYRGNRTVQGKETVLIELLPF
jgi:hypothetical protein